MPQYGDIRSAFKIWSGNMRERDLLEDLGIDGTIKLKCISKKFRWGIVDWIYLIHCNVCRPHLKNRIS